MIIEKTNVFQDQERFMQACDQTTHKQNKKQFKMYHKLIKEEVKELKEAIKLEKDINCLIELAIKNTLSYDIKLATEGKKAILDALIDILVVTIGAGHSMGFNMEGAWNEVMKTNFAKINSETGKVIKREDGKVLKPEGWKEPELETFLKK